MTVTEITSSSVTSAIQMRKFSDVSNANLSCNSSQFHILLDLPNKGMWKFTDSKCYNIEDNNLNRVQQALFLKFGFLQKQGLSDEQAKAGKTLKANKISPPCLLLKPSGSPVSLTLATRDILSIQVCGFSPVGWGTGRWWSRVTRSRSRVTAAGSQQQGSPCCSIL